MVTPVLLLVLSVAVILIVDRRNLISPVNSIAVFIWLMVVRAAELHFLQFKTAPWWAESYLSESALVNALVVIGLFLLCFIAGYFVPLLHKRNHAVDRRIVQEREGRFCHLPFRLGMVGLVGVGVFFFLALMWTVGEPTDIVLRQVSPSFFEGKGPLVAGMSLAPAGALGIMMSCRKRRTRLMGFGALLLTSFVVYAPLGQRWNLLSYWLLGLCVWEFGMRRVRLTRVLAAIIMLVLAMELLVIWRTAIRYSSSLWDIGTATYLAGAMDRVDFDGLAGVIAERMSLGLESWWSFINQLAPRAIMASKPEYVSVSYAVNSALVGASDSGLTASIIATLYAQGGHLAVAVGGIMFGMIVKGLQVLTVVGGQAKYRPLLCGTATLFVFLMMRSGDLTESLVNLLTNLVGILLIPLGFRIASVLETVVQAGSDSK